MLKNPITYMDTIYAIERINHVIANTYKNGPLELRVK